MDSFITEQALAPFHSHCFALLFFAHGLIKIPTLPTPLGKKHTSPASGALTCSYTSFRYSCCCFLSWSSCSLQTSKGITVSRSTHGLFLGKKEMDRHQLLLAEGTDNCGPWEGWSSFTSLELDLVYMSYLLTTTINNQLHHPQSVAQITAKREVSSHLSRKVGNVLLGHLWLHHGPKSAHSSGPTTLPWWLRW